MAMFGVLHVVLLAFSMVMVMLMLMRVLSIRSLGFGLHLLANKINLSMEWQHYATTDNLITTYPLIVIVTVSLNKSIRRIN
jgi:hypothetical protein